MSERITQKEVKRMHDYCIRCGAEEMHYLLYSHNRIGYTAGIYGWNADIYSVYSEKYGRIAIVTGYRGFGINSDRKIIVKHEYACKRYREKYSIWTDYEKVKKYANKHLEKCIDEILDNALKGA